MMALSRAQCMLLPSGRLMVAERAWCCDTSRMLLAHRRRRRLRHCCCMYACTPPPLGAQAATSGNWAGLLAASPVVSVTRGSTLADVFEILAVRGLHRVYVVDGDGSPVSIITLTDLLRLVTKA